MQDGARRVPGKEPVLPYRAWRANDLSLKLLERPETPALPSQILPGFGRLQLQGFPGNDAGGSTSPDSGTHICIVSNDDCGRYCPVQHTLSSPSLSAVGGG